MDMLVIICFSIIIGLLGLLAFLLVRSRNSPDGDEIDLPDEEESTADQTSSASRPIDSQNELRVGNKVIKSRNAKTPNKRSTRQHADDDEANNDEFDETAAAQSTSMIEQQGKIGKKKLQKLGNYQSSIKLD